MSISPLKKVTLVGLAQQKTATLSYLQDLGCMHLVPLSEPPAHAEDAKQRNAEDAYKALHFLAAVEGQRRLVTQDDTFDVEDFVIRTLELKQKLREVGDRRDFLADRIQTLGSWGEIAFPDHEALAGIQLWFYQLPVKERASLDRLDVPWEIVSRDTQFFYVAILSTEEPDEDLLPVPRTHVGDKPVSVLETELEAAEIELETLHAERISLTRYLFLLRRDLALAETQAEIAFAEQQTRDEADVFAVQGWVPEADLAAVETYTEAHELAMIVEDPAWDETPPTRIVQPETEAAGVDLAMFYQIPNYRGWDPTLLLAFSFAIFFAMIVADAGYGAVIMVGLLAGWKRLDSTAHLRAWRRLGLIIAGATIAYGVIVGSYFGVAPADGSIPSYFILLSLNDFDTMMRLSILVGVAHLVIAIAMNARARWASRSSRAQLGWIGMILGGMLIWLSGQVGPGFHVGIAVFVGGLVAVIWFTSERPIEKRPDMAWRLFDGVKALNGAMGAFGDVLSYMRLFALGLASASLALTFNDLATQVMDALPGIGILLGLLILLIGHVLNFGLALMSGVVHGLRLNYIEFFKWGLPDEGVAFRPLARKEIQT
ncbi:V-type ATP synthase subunit I [Yoonia sp. R2-816]|uniref:V-type ATP synthase subunit I n=1 Tax=Yoonia sp. R2-816 TaxID=3342638 RepID=UPI00372B0946